MTMRNGGKRVRGAALGALLMGTAATGAMLVPQAAMAQQAYSFDIPAQTVEGAIALLSRQSGWQVAYGSDLRGLRTRAVQGSMTADQALGQMFAGTGVQIRVTGPRSAALLRPAAAGAAPGAGTTLDTISVEGESATGPVPGLIATRSATATRTDTPLIATPQTVNVIGRTQMDQQGANSVTEALRYTPGIVSGTNGGQDARYDTYFVRGSGGFSADADTASTVDGLRWRIPSRTGVQFDPWLIERVEVLKGPSGMLFGSASPGGLVNLVEKRPSFETSHEVSATVGTDDFYQLAYDTTGAINDQWAYRMLFVGHSTGSAVDYQHGQRLVLAPSVTWAPGKDTTVTFQAMYHRDNNAPDANFVPAYGSVLSIPGKGRVDGSFWQGDTNYQKYQRTEAAIGWQADHAFSDALSFHSGLRLGKLKTEAETMEVYGASSGTIYRYPYVANHDTWTLATDNYLKGQFALGETRHTVLAGVDYQKLGGSWQDGWNYSTFPNALDMFNPVYGRAAGTPVLLRDFNQPFKQFGYYLQDQMELGNWRFVVGLRHDTVQTANTITYIPTGSVLATSTKASSSAATGQIGAVYLFDNGLAPFLSYSTSFEPQLGLLADGTPADPSSGRMVEGGLRYLAADGKLALSGTLFSGTEKNYAVAASSATCLVSTSCVTDDNKRDFKGIELEAKAELASGLDLISSVTWQKSRLTEYMGQDTDLHVVGAPDSYASVWLNYTVPEAQALYGWSFGGGVRYIGQTYGTTSNVWHDDSGAFDYGAYDGQASKVPSFTLFDASVGYDFGAYDSRYKGLKGRLTVANLFDKNYVAACNGYGTCSFGDGRSLRLNIDYTW